jgi:homoserine kinase
MTKSDDDAVFHRELGEPERVTAAQKPTVQAAFNPFTQKVTAAASDSKQVQSSTAAWAGGLMRSAASIVRDLSRADIVSYVVPHEQHADGVGVVHVGRVVASDPKKASVQIQEYQKSDDGRTWSPVPTHHFVGYKDVQAKLATFPNVESDEPDSEEFSDAKVRASFQAFFTGR